MIETHDIYYDANNLDDFNRQYAQWRLKNPTAREVEQSHVMVDVRTGAMKGTIKFEIEEQ
jgi:hypothetical protein